MSELSFTLRQIVDEGLTMEDMRRAARLAVSASPPQRSIGLASGGDFDPGGEPGGGSGGVAFGPDYMMTAAQLRDHLEAHHEDSPAGLGAMSDLARHQFDHNGRGDAAIGHTHASAVQASNGGTGSTRGGNAVNLSETDVQSAAEWSCEMIDYLEETGQHAEAARLAAEMAVDLGHDPGALQALELATQMGGFPAAAGSYGTRGGTIELSNGRVVDLNGPQQFIDLVDAQVNHENIRRAEDRSRPARGATADDRLNAALDRVRRGTLLPQGMYRAGLEFSGASVPGGVTGEVTCGPADDLGYCTEQYHDASCGSYAGNDVALSLINGGVYMERSASAVTDDSGRTWKNQYGVDMDLVQLLESVSGQRLANTRLDLFETGHGTPETFRAQPVQVWGDPSDPEGPGGFEDIPATAHLDAHRLATSMGITTGNAAAARARLRADPRRAAMQTLTARRMGDGSGETMRERAERHQGSPVSWDDSQADLSNTYAPLPGELPRYTRGEIALATPARPRTTTASSGGDQSTDSNGLNPSGQAIYKRLLARGFPVARALSFAKNAQNAKPGTFRKVRA